MTVGIVASPPPPNVTTLKRWSGFCIALMIMAMFIAGMEGIIVNGFIATPSCQKLAGYGAIVNGLVGAWMACAMPAMPADIAPYAMRAAWTRIPLSAASCAVFGYLALITGVPHVYTAAFGEQVEQVVVVEGWWAPLRKKSWSKCEGPTFARAAWINRVCLKEPIAWIPVGSRVVLTGPATRFGIIVDRIRVISYGP